MMVLYTQGPVASNVTLKLNIHFPLVAIYVAISSSLRYKQVAGAPNDCFLLHVNHALKTRVLFDL